MDESMKVVLIVGLSGIGAVLLVLMGLCIRLDSAKKRFETVAGNEEQRRSLLNKPPTPEPEPEPERNVPGTPFYPVAVKSEPKLSVSEQAEVMWQELVLLERTQLSTDAGTQQGAQAAVSAKMAARQLGDTSVVIMPPAAHNYSSVHDSLPAPVTAHSPAVGGGMLSQMPATPSTPSAHQVFYSPTPGNNQSQSVGSYVPPMSHLMAAAPVQYQGMLPDQLQPMRAAVTVPQPLLQPVRSRGSKKKKKKKKRKKKKKKKSEKAWYEIDKDDFSSSSEESSSSSSESDEDDSPMSRHNAASTAGALGSAAAALDEVFSPPPIRTVQAFSPAPYQPPQPVYTAAVAHQPAHPTPHPPPHQPHQPVYTTAAAPAPAPHVPQPLQQPPSTGLMLAQMQARYGAESAAIPQLPSMPGYQGAAIPQPHGMPGHQVRAPSEIAAQQSHDAVSAELGAARLEQEREERERAEAKAQRIAEQEAKARAEQEAKQAAERKKIAVAKKAAEAAEAERVAVERAAERAAEVEAAKEAELAWDRKMKEKRSAMKAADEERAKNQEALRVQKEADAEAERTAAVAEAIESETRRRAEAEAHAAAAAEAEERDQREKMAAMTPAQRRIYTEHLEQERKEAEWNRRD